MVLLLNASVLLETKEETRVNKFGGKEKTERERGGALQAIRRPGVLVSLLQRKER